MSADAKISSLPSAGGLTGAELVELSVPLLPSGFTSKQTTTAAIAGLAGGVTPGPGSGGGPGPPGMDGADGDDLLMIPGAQGPQGPQGPGGGGGGAGNSVAITLSGTLTTIDAAAASLYEIDLTANTAVTLAGAVAGKDVEVVLVVTQGGASPATLSFPTDIAWPGNTPPTLTTAIGHADIIRLLNGNGSQWYGFVEAANVFGPPPPGVYDSTVLADSPVAYWKLDETTGTVAADSGPHGLLGTYSGTLALGQAAIGLGLGDSVLFTNGIVDVPHNTLFDFTSGPYSLEIWLKPSALGSFQEPLTNGSSNGWRLVLSSTALQIFINNINLFGGSTVYANATQYHIVLTYDPAGLGAMKLYVNGFLDTTVNTGANGQPLTGIDINIGNLSGVPVHPFAGNVSNVALYASALSPARVTAHFLAGH